mgnify:CR=1 FL=1
MVVLYLCRFILNLTNYDFLNAPSHDLLNAPNHYFSWTHLSMASLERT